MYALHARNYRKTEISLWGPLVDMSGHAHLFSHMQELLWCWLLPAVNILFQNLRLMIELQWHRIMLMECVAYAMLMSDEVCRLHEYINLSILSLLNLMWFVLWNLLSFSQTFVTLQTHHEMFYGSLICDHWQSWSVLWEACVFIFTFWPYWDHIFVSCLCLCLKIYPLN